MNIVLATSFFVIESFEEVASKNLVVNEIAAHHLQHGSVVGNVIARSPALESLKLMKNQITLENKCVNATHSCGTSVHI